MEKLMKNNSKYLFYGAAFAVCMGTASCSDDKDLGEPMSEVTVISSVTLGETRYNADARNLYMLPNQEVQLTCTVLPEEAEDKGIAWSVQNNTKDAAGNAVEAATVTPDGLVIAKEVGIAIVRATPAIGFGATDATPSYTVHVVDHFDYIENFEVENETSLSSEGISEAATCQLEVTAFPENATFKRYTFKSSDESLATVDKNGLITGMRANGGETKTVTVTVTADDFSSNPVSKEIEVKLNPIVEPTAMDVKADAKDYLAALGYGEQYDLRNAVTLTPAGATFELIEWTSSDKSVASVDANGILTVNGMGGTATLTATCGGMTATVDVAIAGGRLWYSFAEDFSDWRITEAASIEADGEKTTVTLSNDGKGRLHFDGDLALGLEYPILALKIRLPYRVISGSKNNGSFFMVTDWGNFDGGSGDGRNAFEVVDGYESQFNENIPETPMVCYFDLSKGFGGNGNNPVHNLPASGVEIAEGFNFRCVDFPAACLGYYELYWVRSFKTVEDLQEYLTETENNNNE